MTKKELRDKLKTLGYNCSFNVHHSPFSGGADLEVLSLIVPGGQKLEMLKANVYGKDFSEKHRKAFELCAEFKGGKP